MVFELNESSLLEKQSSDSIKLKAEFKSLHSHHSYSIWRAIVFA